MGDVKSEPKAQPKPEIKPETKVFVENLTKWALYFKRVGGVGDIRIPAGIKSFGGITFEEAQMQIQTGNAMFIGTDGAGGHARIRIVDDEIRAALFGIEKDEAPVALTLDAVKALLAIKQKGAFSKRLAELVATDAERRMIVELAKKAGSDDAEAWKIEAIQKIAQPE
jgi:hypothetical protein